MTIGPSKLVQRAPLLTQNLAANGHLRSRTFGKTHFFIFFPLIRAWYYPTRSGVPQGPAKSKMTIGPSKLAQRVPVLTQHLAANGHLQSRTFGKTHFFIFFLLSQGVILSDVLMKKKFSPKTFEIMDDSLGTSFRPVELNIVWIWGSNFHFWPR